MKQIIFSGWNWFRILRLVLGCIIIAQAFAMKDVMFGIAGLLFSVMAIFNVSCCGVGSCGIPPQKNATNNINDIQYEEIK